MRIINKKILSQIQGVKVISIEVTAPSIAGKAKPGQFVVIMVSEEGERIPLTVVDKDKVKGTITLIFQEVGLTTGLLGKLGIGDSLYALAGPLGHATEIKNYGKLILAGGGVGIAEIYPVARGLKAAGNFITAVLGAKTEKQLILKEELSGICDEVHIATDDGSYGRGGFVTDILGELLGHQPSAIDYRLIYAVGPIPMMRKVCLLAGEFNLKTIVSLNALMVDATGMCGCCRVTVGKETKFSCVDGPEFDGQAVDWDEMEKRNKVYADKEKHICALNKII